MKSRIVGALMRVTFLTLALVGLLAPLATPGTAAGQEDAPYGITVVLVIDDSGSMADTDPQKRRGLGGRILIERLFPEDRLGTVLFARHARVVQAVSPVENDANRDNQKRSFELLQAAGATDMLDALTEAFTQLEQDPADNPKLVVFLTDGQLLPPDGASPEYGSDFQDLLKAYRGQGWPIFPISFGRDVDTQFLENVAEVTGGETCDAPTDSELVPCFQTVLDTFKQTERVLQAQSQCLGAGEEAGYPVFVDPYARQLSLVLAREDPAARAQVFDPAGSSQGTPREEGKFLFYNVDRPDTGTWMLKLIGPGCFSESLAYIQSDVRIDLKSPDVVHAARQPMNIRAAVQGRRPNEGSAWETLPGGLALSIASPQGRATDVPLQASRPEHNGRYASATELGDYRLTFQATVEFQDAHTGKNMERTYVRKKRVEVVEAPVLEVTVDDGQVRKILPGDSMEISGRISPPPGAASSDLTATVGGARLPLDASSNGTFSGGFTPDRAGTHELEFSFETTLTGLYGEVSYPATRSVEILVDFQPLSLQLDRENPGDKVTPGEPVSLVGRVMSAEGPVHVEQPAITLGLKTPAEEMIQVDLAGQGGNGEFRGQFVPEESGQYILSEVNTDLTRNGVPLSIETGQALDIALRPLLEADINTLALGEVYPGAVITRLLRVSNRSDQQISLLARTDSRDLSVGLSPALVPASSEMQPIQAQFQVSPEVGGGGAPAGLFLDANPESGVGPGLVIPVTYEVGDFFVELKDWHHDLGYIRQDNLDVPVNLEFGFKSPVPVNLTATVLDATGQRVIDLSPSVLEPQPPAGEGSQAARLVLPLLHGREPGAYQGVVTISTDPPIPLKPQSEVQFSYRLPSALQIWVLDNGWWTLLAGGGAFLALLLVWGGVVAERVTLQGRLLIYDRSGLERTRREDLRWYQRARLTIGCKADVSLPNRSGVIDEEHAEIVASRGTPYPRVYPIGMARVIGPFGEDVDTVGAPLGNGDTFSIGQYNLEWSPTWAGSRIGRVLGDPWWRIGFAVSAVAVGTAAAVFYLVIL